MHRLIDMWAGVGQSDIDAATNQRRSRLCELQEDILNIHRDTS